MLHFRRAATASPYSGVAWVNLAAELRSAGDTEKAANAARRAVCLAPALSVALFAAAEAAAAAFNHAATAKRYDRVLKVDPAHTAAYQNRGHARRRQGRTEAAIRDYRPCRRAIFQGCGGCSGARRRPTRPTRKPGSSGP
jgi:tetratricopeptide (TPR) repeat protein